MVTEARIILSQCAVYLATSPKSNASYMAIGTAQQLVKETGDLPVPLHPRNAPSELMGKLGYGKGYAHDHNVAGGFSSQECMPDQLIGQKLYEPGKNAREEHLRQYLRTVWKSKYGY